MYTILSCERRTLAKLRSSSRPTFIGDAFDAATRRCYIPPDSTAARGVPPHTLHPPLYYRYYLTVLTVVPVLCYCHLLTEHRHALSVRGWHRAIGACLPHARPAAISVMTVTLPPSVLSYQVSRTSLPVPYR